MVHGGVGGHVGVVHARLTDRSTAGAQRSAFFGASDIGFAGGTGEQSVVTDAMEIPWAGTWRRKRPDELVGRERHRAVNRACPLRR